MTTICYAFILYNPGPNVFRRIAHLAASNKHVYILENSKIPAEVIPKSPFIHITPFSENLGLGKGLNLLLKRCIKNEHQFAVFFDQDTNFSERSISYIEDIIKNFNQWEKYGTLSFNASNPSNSKLVYVDLCINSGTAFNLTILNQLNGHDPSYFVDGVDYEYCYRLAQNKYQMGLITNTPGFDHSSEQDGDVIEFAGRSLEYRIYSRTRTLDILKSLSRLIIKSLSDFNFRYAAKFGYFLIRFILSQVSSRMLIFLLGKGK